MPETENQYLHINQSLWDSRVERHMNSSFYDVKGFLNGKEILNAPELDLLGDVRGKKLLHLQCHFGLDSLALGRKGAVVTGVDFSPRAIENAIKLSMDSGIPATFFCTDIYSVPQNISGLFDIVFTSYGTVGWLPDIHKWAEVISRKLLPGGKFIMADFHPVIWMYDSEFTKIQYSYFNEGPIIEMTDESYADKSKGQMRKSIGWNHSMAEIIGSLLDSGLIMDHFSEYDYSPYPCFQGLENENGKYRIKHLNGKIPMMFSLRFCKPLQ